MLPLAIVLLHMYCVLHSASSLDDLPLLCSVFQSLELPHIHVVDVERLSAQLVSYR
jgi:hypothetical protein